MAPNPIFVKLRVADANNKNYFFLGRPNGANVNLATVTDVHVATPDEQFHPILLVRELLNKDILTRLYVAYTDSSGYSKVANMLVANTSTTSAGLLTYQNKLYKTASKSGTIKYVHYDRDRFLKL